MTYSTFSRLAIVLLLGMVTQACALGAAAGAGALAADEYNEAKRCGDGFDPLEGARGKEDGCN